MINSEKLKSLVLENTVIPFKFASQRFLADGRAVLFWPEQDLLVFSDLHFEKGSFLTQFAHPVPRFDTRETVKRMSQLISEYQPKTVLCLGDSFHDVNARSRIEKEDLENINQLVMQTKRWVWILGNHDPDIPETLAGERAHSLLLDEILFVHEPEDISNHTHCKAQVVGHFHPKTSYKLTHKKVTGKSFVFDEKLLLMPAFGKYTGGLSTSSEIIGSLVNKNNCQIMLTFNKKLFML
uniref:ligase-associated DNA damage response endonuclease PdeM n=1 Tax=Ningiella ruwaisensis TaxID=2364274 RepID=UPI00109F4FC6|nr:ligase-associated DNA damage response endonuclease PdeM [Ningiella ruwaisensis]